MRQLETGRGRTDDFGDVVPRTILPYVVPLNLDSLSLMRSAACYGERMCIARDAFMLPPSLERSALYMDNKRFDFSGDMSGSLLALHKGQEFNGDFTGPCRPYLTCVFRDGYLAAVSEEVFGAPAVRFEPRLYVASQDLRTDVARIIDESERGEPGADEVREDLASILTVDLLRCTSPRAAADLLLRAQHPGIRKAIRLIESNFDAHLSIEELAEAAGIGKSQLIAVFKRDTGVTPHEHLRNVRIEAAKRLLRAGKDVTDACFEVGYASLSAFERAFTRRAGMNPRAYRRAMRA